MIISNSIRDSIYSILDMFIQSENNPENKYFTGREILIQILQIYK